MPVNSGGLIEEERVAVGSQVLDLDVMIPLTRSCSVRAAGGCDWEAVVVVRGEQRPVDRMRSRSRLLGSCACCRDIIASQLVYFGCDEIVVAEWNYTQHRVGASDAAPLGL